MDVFDYRHEGPAPVWGDDRLIAPEHGFFWSTRTGQLALHSSGNCHASAVAVGADVGGGKTSPEFFNVLGGLVDFSARSITIEKESYTEDRRTKYRVRGLYDVTELKETLIALLAFGVESDFLLKGTPKGFEAKTVADALSMPNPVDRVLHGNEELVLYHGTSLERWRRIREEGLVPGRVKLHYSDLRPGYSETKVYLAMRREGAEFYARQQRKWDKDEACVVLAVRVPDRSLFRANDMFLRYDGEPFEVQGRDPNKIMESLSELGEICYAGPIPPEFIASVIVSPASAASLSASPANAARTKVPCRFFVSDDVIGNLPVGQDELTGAHASRPGDLDDARIEKFLRRERPDGFASRQHGVVMSGLGDWSDPVPEGCTAVLPCNGEYRAHDRSWIDEVAAQIAVGQFGRATAAARSYWAGRPLHGDWEYLTRRAIVIGVSEPKLSIARGR